MYQVYCVEAAHYDMYIWGVKLVTTLQSKNGDNPTQTLNSTSARWWKFPYTKYFLKWLTLIMRTVIKSTDIFLLGYILCHVDFPCLSHRSRVCEEMCVPTCRRGQEGLDGSHQFCIQHNLSLILRV